MRKFLPLFSIPLMFASCGKQPETFTINGTTKNANLNGEYIYLFDYEKNMNIDSVLIENNSFTFNGSATEEKVARVKINRLYADVIIEPGIISLNLETKDSISGTPLNDLKSKYNQSNTEWTNEINKIYEDMVAANKSEDEINSFEGSLDSLYVAKNLDILNVNKSNALGKYIVYDILYSVSDTEFYISKLSNETAPTAFEFAPTKKVIARIENSKKTAEGSVFTDFIVENGNLDGSVAKLSDYVGNGKYVLVDFWASWCGPCRKETPLVSSVYEKYKGNDFDVLSVAVWDKPENTLKASAELGVNWNQIINAQSEPTELYGIAGIPHIILFGPDGTIIARNLRGEEIEKAIEKALKK